MLKNRQVITAKIEGTYGTDAAPAATDAVLVENLNWANEGLRMNERPAVRSSLGKLKKIYGGRLKKLTFDCEVKGSGTAGTAPEVGVLLRACAMAETIVASTSVTYKPASTGHESITIYFYRDGTLMKFTGTRGNAGFNFEVGKQGMISFEFIGHISAVTDVAIVAPTYDSTVPVPFINVGFSFGAYAAVISKLSANLSNVLATPPNANATDGYAAVQITDRDVNGSFDPEDTLVATKNWLADLEAGTTYALTTGVIGSTAGNRYQFSGSAAYVMDASQGDRDGVLTYEIPVGFTESTGDDEISLVFT